jgi:uncharacterized protein (TIGR02270 family)
MARTYVRPAPEPDVLEEYLEEAAFLYGARRRCLTDPELSWTDLEDYDRRLQAHLHGLILSGPSCIELLRGKLLLEEDDDPGESFTAAAVYSSLGLTEPMLWLLEAVAARPPHAMALIDGMTYSRTDHLDGWMKTLLAHEDPAVRAAGARVAGDRWTPGSEARLSPLLDDREPEVALAAACALQQNGAAVQAHRIAPCLDSEDPAVVRRAVHVMLQGGDASVSARLRQMARQAEPPIRGVVLPFLAVAGTWQDASLILELAGKEPETEAACLLALGLAGHEQAVPILLRALEAPRDEESFTAAYQALRTLTGRDLLPEFDLDEATPEEMQAYRKQWEEVCRKQSFRSQSKWRRGAPLDPQVLFSDLTRAGNPHRDLTDLEMRVRYGCRLPFRPDADVETQRRQLEKIGQWAEKAGDKFRPGALYLDGREI